MMDLMTSCQRYVLFLLYYYCYLSFVLYYIHNLIVLCCVQFNSDSVLGSPYQWTLLAVGTSPICNLFSHLPLPSLSDTLALGH